MRIANIEALVAAVLVAGCAAAPAQAPAPATSASASASASAAAATGPAPAAGMPGRGPAPGGYLPPNTIDMRSVLMPAPKSGDARDATDRRVFRETRALQGTPRWQMAIDDGELGSAAL